MKEENYRTKQVLKKFFHNSDVVNERLKEEAEQIAKQALKNFFHNLDLDEELFEYMNDIPINLESNKDDDSVAAWRHNSGKIVVNRSEIEDIISTNLGVDINKITIHVATSIVHELLHANRTVLVNDEISKSRGIREYEYRKCIKEKEGHDFNQYRLFLSDMLRKKYVENFDTYIPIKVKKVNDKLDIILYNRKEKRYEQCKGMNFDFDYNGNVDEYLEKIGYELNKKTIKSEIILEIFNPKANKNPNLVSEYYFGNEKLFDVHDREHYSRIRKILKEIGNQNGLEESLTEVVANIIMISRKSEKLNLHENIEKMKKSDRFDFSEKIGLEIIDKMGEEFLIWFMTSAHELYYHDLLRETFKEDYPELLKCVNKLYESGDEESEKTRKYFELAHEIIEKTFRKNKKRT